MDIPGFAHKSSRIFKIKFEYTLLSNVDIRKSFFEENREDIPVSNGGYGERTIAWGKGKERTKMCQKAEKVKGKSGKIEESV